MRLTKLQIEYVDQFIPSGSYIAFPLSIFKSKEYKKWKRLRFIQKK